MFKRSMIIAVLLIIMIVGAASAQAIDNTASYDVEVLPTLDDMPYGFYIDTGPGKLESNGGLSNYFTTPLVIEDELNRQGRTGGFYVSFQNTQWSSRKDFANFNVSFSVINFENAEGAADYFESTITREVLRRNVVKVAEMSGPTLGDASVHVFKEYDESQTVDTYVLVDNAVLLTGATANIGTADLDQLFEAAKMFFEKSLRY